MSECSHKMEDAVGAAEEGWLREGFCAACAQTHVFTRADAETILHMADVCFGEGIGPDYSDLIGRIRAQYPDIAESYSHIYRDGWNVHQNLDEAPARVITRVMDDGIKTKDGAA